MKALRYLGPQKLEIRELEKPRIGKDEVLLKIHHVGICGSDLHGWLGTTGRRLPPMTMGHEFSAEIVEKGEAISKFDIGDGVVVQPINFCSHCMNCSRGLTNLCLNKKFFGVFDTDGAMAEYLAVPEKQLYRLPPGVSYLTGSLVEPYAVAYGSIVKLGPDALTGQNVMIFGAGMIGLCVLQQVKIQNPKRIFVCDLSGKRLEFAKEMGADILINPKEEDPIKRVADETGGIMIDTSFEAIGVEATANQSVQCLAVSGRSVWIGMSQKEMTINMHDVVCFARHIIGSFNYTHKEFGEVVKLIESGKLDPEKMVSKIISLEEAPQTFADLHHRPDDSIKISIDMTKS